MMHRLILAFFVFGFSSSNGKVATRLFDPGYLEGDCNYHSITAASDGNIYFSISTHQPESSARIFRFDPKNESIRQIGDLGEIFGTDVNKETPHGKIHTGLIDQLPNR